MNHSPRFTSAHQTIRCLACRQDLTLLDGAVWASQEDGADCPTVQATGGWWRLEISDETYLDDDDREMIADLIRNGFTSGQIVHTPTGGENRLVIVPIRPTDDPRWAGAWAAFTTGVPRDQLALDVRANAEEAVTAGIAHWAPVGGIWRLRWNFPDPTKIRRSTPE